MFSETAQEQILFDKIYQYLWCKSDTSLPPPTLIPETIIIVRAQPIFWYYSDKIDGGVRKRKQQNVSKAAIKEKWLKTVGRSGVVAYLLHFCENLNLMDKTQQPKDMRIGTQIQVIYFDEKCFCDFMDNETCQFPFGILQKFVETKEEKNCLIQALWSKSITLYSKRTNRKNLHNRKMNVYERCCTFEGPEYFSEASQVKDFQSQRISKQIGTMIQHLDDISYGKLNILQGTFYFKVDKEARCWFLFCGNMKFEGDKKKVSQLNRQDQNFFTQTQIQIPRTVDPIMSVYSDRPVRMEKNLQCVRCDKLEKPCNFQDVPYQYFIEEKDIYGKVLLPDKWPEEIRQNAQKVKLSSRDKGDGAAQDYLNTYTQIPLILERLHYKLNQQNYAQFKNDFEFQSKQIRVCQACYIELITYQESQFQAQVDDNLDYLMYIESQNVKPHHIKARLQYLNYRKKKGEEHEKKKEFTSPKPSALSDRTDYRKSFQIPKKAVELYMESRIKNFSSQQLSAKREDTDTHQLSTQDYVSANRSDLHSSIHTSGKKYQLLWSVLQKTQPTQQILPTTPAPYQLYKQVKENLTSMPILRKLYGDR